MAYDISSTAMKNKIADLKYIGKLHLRQSVSIAGRRCVPWIYTGDCSAYAHGVTRRVKMIPWKIVLLAAAGKNPGEE